MSGRGQWADHVPHGCNRLISISRRWGWARHLPGVWPDRGHWNTGGKWTQQHTAPAHAPIPDHAPMVNDDQQEEDGKWQKGE